LEVVGQGVVRGLDALIRPLPEEFGLYGELGFVVLFGIKRVVAVS